MPQGRQEDRGGIKKALSIAGSDSGGGAGIQADLKTFAALGVYGSSVITAVTAQNTLGVQGISGLAPEFVLQQMESVLADIGADAVKTGMLYNAAIIKAVAGKLKESPVPWLVVDPVMVATSGDRLLTPDGERALREELLPLASFITPNVSEAAVLWGRPIEGEEDLCRAARALHELGPRFVVITGIRRNTRSLDLCFDGKEFRELEGPFFETPHTHGTGCTFSAALAALLARGFSPWQALALAKEYVAAGLRYAYPVGRGRGPLNHLAPFFPGDWGDPGISKIRAFIFQNWGSRPDLGPFPALYCIIGGVLRGSRSYAELARVAVQEGARLVQLREKEGESRELVRIAREMQEVCRSHGALFIVNDRVDVAAAAGADGVHLGQEDLSPQAARAILGPGKIIGVSVDNLAQAEAAAAAGADYLGLGPVYPTASKDCGVPPCGPDLVEEVARRVGLPVFAIGGITPENTLPLLRAGAAGVAVISSFLGAPDPRKAVRAFLDVFHAFKSRKDS
ncbi:MAG: bifunctional hydroxymethylpyrimidine kinase/phosphomethylpyrimidine kinase [Firmicutes bacterium]|nr:bifunctional hydroxymethylpyrimidine kinase/phosphomethylpyrimidine kinase [Bacillota bacterium]